MPSVKAIPYSFISKKDFLAAENQASEDDDDDPAKLFERLEEMALEHGYTDVHTFIRIIKLTRNSGEHDA